MEKLYREFEQLTINNEPLICAGIMMAQALKIYKTVLPEEDFRAITERVLESRNDILLIEPPTLN